MTIEHHIQGIVDLFTVQKVALIPVDESDLEPEADEVDDDEGAAEVDDDVQESVEKSIHVPFIKAADEEQTVTGIVLKPEVTDGHLDVMSAAVIKETAYKFLAGLNKTTKVGVQHTVFKKGQLELVESYIAPMDMVLGSKSVPAGAWVITMRVLDKKLWKKIKDGLITGFSIGGIAKVVPIAA